MVLSGTLRGLLLCLLSLSLRGTEAQNVDQNALARIISHIQTKYCPRQGDQFAVAINVPARYCAASSNLDDGEFLKQDKPADVIKDMRGNNKVYNGKQLIGATRKQSNNKGFFHSEYLLLKDPTSERSLMQNLLNKDKNGCVVFYTYNSPCIGTCLNEDRDRNIVDALEMFQEHKGPKAFVYNKIFENNFDLEEFTKKIDNEVKLYRCYAARKHSPDRSSNRNRDRTSNRNRDRSSSSNRDRPSTSERDRSRSPIDSQSSNAYECHPCFNAGNPVEECLDMSL